MEEKNKGRGFCGFFVLLALVLVIALFLVGYYFYSIYAPQGSSDNTQDTQEVLVTENASIGDVSNILHDAGVLKNKTVFEVYYRIHHGDDEFAPGLYQIDSSYTIIELYDVLISGDQVLANTITIPEGFQLSQVADRYGDFLVSHSTNPDLTQDQAVEDFLSAALVSNYVDEYDFLSTAPSDATLEGFLFPDTYEIFTDAKPDALIRKMLDNFAVKVTDDLLAEISDQNMTLFDVVVMASIVQKEVSNPYMGDVAGVFYNRLDLGMKLQSDTTVNYITGKNDPTSSFSDTRIDSLYNTYVYPGLPPGPISNPGIQAIKASVFPSSHDYYFFLTKPDSGEPVFSKNGAEHLENQDKYY